MVEVIIAVFVVVVALASILNAAVISLRSSFNARLELQAQSLAQEALEAVRNFRDGVAWNNQDQQHEYDGLGVVAKGVAYRPLLSGDNPPRWKLVQGQESQGVFARSILFGEVRRDANSNIVLAGGAIDPNTAKVTATVSWLEQGVARQSELVMYLTNWRE